MRAARARSAALSRLCDFAQSSGASARGASFSAALNPDTASAMTGDVLRRLALLQQDLGARDRLPPFLVATHFSARISAKVSFAVSKASRISGTPT